jgi:hypothetical protein
MQMTKFKAVLLAIIFIRLCMLSLERHKNIPPDTFRSELWTDRAGYNVFLPATFIYSYTANAFPNEIERKTGEGFNLTTGKIITKYTYGVALMQLPFFLTADFITKYSNYPRDGYSYFYRQAINIASVFYLVLGLYLLFLALKAHTKYNSAILISTLLLTFFGTNLYYYSIVETGMSHVYSFFLFSFILYIITNTEGFRYKLSNKIILSLIVWLSILIRPTNIIFTPILFLWDTSSFQQLFFTFKKKCTFENILIYFVSFLIVFSPQLFYWKYAYGSFFTYSYGSEGFSNLFNPYLSEVIFSPKNGLIPYSIVFVLIIIGIVIMLKHKTADGIKYLAVVFAVIYLTASWHTWQFGCGAGMRNMVEYYSLLSFPLSFLIFRLFSVKKIYLKGLLFLTLTFFVILNFRTNYNFYGCYFGGTWEWAEYFKTLAYPYKIKSLCY